MTKLHDLTPSQRRVMLAEAAGWKLADLPNHPNGPKRLWMTPEGRQMQSGTVWSLPDPDNSLDDCHQLEAGLTDEEHGRFRKHLREIVKVKDNWLSEWTRRAYISAKPDQRASALLLTLVEGMEL